MYVISKPHLALTLQYYCNALLCIRLHFVKAAHSFLIDWEHNLMPPPKNEHTPFFNAAHHKTCHCIVVYCTVLSIGCFCAISLGAIQNEWHQNILHQGACVLGWNMYFFSRYHNATIWILHDLVRIKCNIFLQATKKKSAFYSSYKKTYWLYQCNLGYNSHYLI